MRDVLIRLDKGHRDSSREEDEVPRVQDRIQNRSVSRKERPEPLTLPDAVEAHKDFPLGGDLVRARPATQMVLTTAQRRTRWNMLAWVAHTSRSDP